MAKVTLGSITGAPVLASQQLLKEQNEAEGETPQAYKSFVADSEQEAIAYREEHADDEDETEAGALGEDTETVTETESVTQSDTESGELTDAIDEDVSEKSEEEITTEALDDWIRDKTKSSSSAFVRNAGELAAGLSRLGIKYGPGLLNAMYKGTLWTFSRLGTLVVSSAEGISNYIEKSVNSIDKLEARLKTAERVIIDRLNDGDGVNSFNYRNQKVLSQLKVGKSLDIAGNLRQYAGQLTEATNAIAADFEAGMIAVDRLSKSDSKSRVNNFAAFMDVAMPKRGFKEGGPSGYTVRNQYVSLCHTSPAWPGDVNLVFVRPKPSSDLGAIATAYKHADMYVSTGDKSSVGTSGIRSLSASDLVLVAKSAKMLVAACKQVTKTQVKMKQMDESIADAAKRLFYEMADSDAKSDNNDAAANMLYLRAHLASKVFVKGSAACQTHASRVLSASVQLLEDHAKRLTAGV